MKFKRKKNDLEKEEDYVSPSSPNYIINFLADWEALRDRHEGQQEILNEFFDNNAQYMFIRAGRKFSKTTILIDTIWKFAALNPGCVIYLCYPTITQGIEVCWEERRLQTCDSKNDDMFLKYVRKVDDNKHIVTFRNGSFVKVIGTWTEARGRGTQPDLLLTDEIQDCSPEYLVAMDANLAAKNGKSIMSGTPPPIRNHYHDWEEMIKSNPKGKIFHYTSYANTRLPHLQDWLDNKRRELIRINKEDVFIREYLAEDCFVSSARALPDPQLLEHEEVCVKYRTTNFEERIPLVCISIYEKYIAIVCCIMIKRKMVYVLDCEIIKQVWDQSYTKIYNSKIFKEKLKNLEDNCAVKPRRVIWDESNSFRDVVQGFNPVRKDFKWQDRGIPLLREMMNENKITFSMNVGDFGMECQKLLVDEKITTIEKEYPLTCCLSVIANEYFQREKIRIDEITKFDKYESLREAGIVVPKKKKYENFFSTKEIRSR